MHPTPLFRKEAPSPPFHTDPPQVENASLRTNEFRKTMDANYGDKLAVLQALVQAGPSTTKAAKRQIVRLKSDNDFLCNDELKIKPRERYRSEQLKLREQQMQKR